MYSDIKSILQLVSLTTAHGIEEVVLCPGSRNAPIVETFSRCAAVKCHAVTDERSAGFFALGAALRTGRPTAVCCTSGSALLNLYPAVAEAYYQQVPLVVISADRPQAWIGQMDGQTLPQPDVFSSLVKRSVSLPEIRTAEDEWYSNRLINEALLEATHRTCGPVHINVPISEPLFRFTSTELPQERIIRRYTSKDIGELVALMNRYTRRMVICGQATPSDRQYSYMSGEGFVWFSEHIGNTSHPEVIHNFDTALYLLSEEEKRALAPEVIITQSGHIVSKRLKKFLRDNPPHVHLHLSPDGSTPDLFCALSGAVELSAEEFWTLTAAHGGVTPTDYAASWHSLTDTIPSPQASYSELAAVGELMQRIPENSVLHLANSSVVRFAQLYPLKPSVAVQCNRGTSGIEGSLSTAVGYASASPQLNFVAIGDLSFFYDMNALWCGAVTPNLRILLLNNGGGEIFHILPGLRLQQAAHEYIAADHTTSAKGWAEERGFRYMSVTDEGQLHAAMDQFTSPAPCDCPLLMEVFTTKEQDSAILKAYYHQLKHQ